MRKIPVRSLSVRTGWVSRRVGLCGRRSTVSVQTMSSRSSWLRSMVAEIMDGIRSAVQLTVGEVGEEGEGPDVVVSVVVLDGLRTEMALMVLTLGSILVVSLKVRLRMRAHCIPLGRQSERPRSRHQLFSQERRLHSIRVMRIMYIHQSMLEASSQANEQILRYLCVHKSLKSSDLDKVKD